MPIKFRCEKCRQFLGISRAQAGEIVDCPTCGRATRVPTLDGKREPIPKRPELDNADSSLLNALDKLADLGTESSGVEKPGKGRKVSKSVAPVKLSEPIDLKPLEAAGAIPSKSQPSRRKPSASTDSKPDPSANTSVDSDVVLGKLAARAERMQSSAAAPGKSRSVTGWLLIAVGGLAAFGLGWLAHMQQSSSAAVEDVKGDPVVVSGNGEAASTEASPSTGIGGRVTYRKPEGECLPDRGARVIAWPVGFSAAEPWELDGFRSDDAAAQRQIAIDKLREHGGNLTLARDDGSFELQLSSGGDYEILIVSRFAARGIDAAEVSAAQLARLRVCFKEPERLLGRTQFRLLRMKYRGESRQLLDQVFEVTN